MATKPIKFLELHYTMTQILIMSMTVEPSKANREDYTKKMIILILNPLIVSRMQ